MTTQCSFRWCESPAAYVIQSNAGEKLACEAHATGHFRELHRAPNRSILDTVHLHTIPDDPSPRVEQQITKAHDYWRVKLRDAAKGGRIVTPVEPARPQQ
jgi:hypothetical protein